MDGGVGEGKGVVDILIVIAEPKYTKCSYLANKSESSKD